MAEQRNNAFRFRLPWLLPSEPAAAPTPPRPPLPTPQTVLPATTQNPIPPTPSQRPPTSTTTTTRTPTAPSPALRPPTTTQTPIPPTPTSQRPPITTTTQTPIPPNPTSQRPPIATTAQLPTPLPSPQRPPATTQTPIPPIPSQRPSTSTNNQPLIPPTPSPKPPTTTTTQIPNLPSPTQKTLSDALGLSPIQPPPPATASQSPIGTDNQPALVKIPNNQSNQPTNVTQTQTDPPSPSTPPQRPPFRPAGTTQGITSSPQAQASPRNMSQPSRANSQPPSPSRISSQSQVSSQPASPSRVGTQSRAPSQPSSPSRGTIQSRTVSQPSSPSRKQPSQSGSLTRSPSKLASQATGKISSLPSSPAKTSPKIEPKGNSVEQPLSLRTIQQTGEENPPPSSNDPEPLVSEKKEPKITPSPLKSKESLSNTETAIDTTSKTHNSHKNPREIETSQPVAPVPTGVPHIAEKSDSIPSRLDLEVPHEKPRANRDPQEKTTDSMVEHGEIKEKTVNELIAETSKSNAQTKEQPTFEVPKDQKQPDNELNTKEKYTTTPITNGKQPNNKTLHSVDKSPVSESRQRPVASNGEKVPLQNEIRDDISKFAQKMATTHSKKPMDEKHMSIITIAGENRGALMHLGTEMAEREGAIHIRRGYKIKPDESGDTTDGGGSSRGRRVKESVTREDKATKAYVNNNTQGVNNSIVFNSSITQGNPGVHLNFTRYLPEADKSNHKTESLEAHKAEYNVTPAQKLTYEPRVRRRCLRGLFLEPSDSEDDNPEKPQRHGCRYSCGQKSKDGNIDVL